MSDTTIHHKGIQLFIQDLDGVDWIEKLTENQLNVLGMHGNPAELAAWASSDTGAAFISRLRENEIHIEYGIHFTPSFLTQSLFNEHPDWFCMDICGVRDWQGANPCVSNDQLLNYAKEKAAACVAHLPASTHRYQLWAGDARPWCHCEGCQSYTASEQNLILMNAMLEGVRQSDPQGKLAYLAYMETLATPRPRKVKPKKDIFLTFAPYRRNMVQPLTHSNCVVNEQHRNSLRELLETFGTQDASVLEYWLDVSLFSGGRSNPVVEVNPGLDLLKSDIACYAEQGIRDIQCFACRMNADYFNVFSDQALNDYGAALRI